MQGMLRDRAGLTAHTARSWMCTEQRNSRTAVAHIKGHFRRHSMINVAAIKREYHTDSHVHWQTQDVHSIMFAGHTVSLSHFVAALKELGV